MYSYFKNCCCLNSNVMHHHHMHVENELVEIVTIRDHGFEEVIEEYDEEILM